MKNRVNVRTSDREIDPFEAHPSYFTRSPDHPITRFP